ncbi:unnamed protein product [Scytosiphon promiscuus]
MPPAVPSYDEAETRFERWLKNYQSDRTAHERARSAHPDPASLDAHLAAAVRAMYLPRCLQKPAELARATGLLLSGARASPAHFRDNHTAGNLGDLVNALEGQAEAQVRGCPRLVPELGEFLDALTGSGSAAVLTNKRYTWDGGRPLPNFVLQSVAVGHPWGSYRGPRPDRAGTREDRALRRVCLRFLARMAFLSAERTLGEGGTHPFLALLWSGPHAVGVYPLQEIATRYLDDPFNQAATLQVVYLMVFVYRALPWPRRQFLADSEYAEWMNYGGSWSVRSFSRRLMQVAVIVPGFFEAFVDQNLEHVLLATGDLGHFPGRGRTQGGDVSRVFAWNRYFKDRREEERLTDLLQENRLFSAWVCKAGRTFLLETCRQRRRRVVEAVAQGAPSEFAAAVPEVLAFVRGPGVRGKKERLVA